MSGIAPKRQSTQTENPYEAALRAAVVEWADLCKPIAISNGADLERRETKKAALRNLILGLAARVPQDRRDHYLRDLEFATSPPSMRAGATFNNVISLLEHAQRCEWKATEVRRALAERGVAVDAKTLSNVFGYMIKTGRLKRLARGHYQFQGGVLVTSDEVPTFDIPRGGENEN